jgi:protein gp37
VGENSAIEWTHHTFNPWRGCARVSEGCRHCYAETLSKRNPKVLGTWGVDGARVMAAESYWRLPVKWNAEAAAVGERRRVFCASLADVFEDRPDLVDARGRLWRLIHDTPQLDWLLLTKRPENVTVMAPGWFWCWPANAWLGTTVENRDALRRIDHVRDSGAPVVFLSIEPLLEDLGPVDLRGVSWVIVGGESGHGARPMYPEWARAIRDQCVAAGVPFFFKQWGEWRPVAPRSLNIVQVGKKAAGRLLDGQEWNQMPEVRA